MPQKKSRPKQAAGSKQRKRKKRAQASQQKAPVAPPTPTPIDAAPPEPEARRVPELPQPVGLSAYGSIRNDLRKIGIIAGCVIVVLIVLAFIL